MVQAVKTTKGKKALKLIEHVFYRKIFFTVSINAGLGHSGTVGDGGMGSAVKSCKTRYCSHCVILP